MHEIYNIRKNIENILRTYVIVNKFIFFDKKYKCIFENEFVKLC